MKKIYLTVSLVGLTAAVAYAAAPGVQGTGKAGPNTAQYHSYDGLICTDCHTLHNSENGATINNTTLGGTQLNRELLKRGDWTDMCLSCHTEGSNTSATALLAGVENTGWLAPPVMSINGTYTGGSMPAGDFFFSKQDAKKGHNPSYTKGAVLTGSGTSLLMPSDPTLKALPPGGVAITDGEWSCHSCHGMHSRFSDTYSAWRQVKRKVNGKVVTGNETAGTVETTGGTSGATSAGFEPIMSNSRGNIIGTNYNNVRADGNPLEGADLLLPESDTNKNVYRGGFSSFCSACHGDFHGGTGETRATDNGKTNIGLTWQRHPTNMKMNETGVTMTNSSNPSGSKYSITTYTKQVSNAQGTAPNPVGYDYRYPLVQDNADFTVKSATASWATSGTAVGTSRIMCLTCHKAHASQYDNMTRWDANAHSFLPNGAVSGVGAGPAEGDNPAYGCGKCHQKGGATAFVKNF